MNVTRIWNQKQKQETGQNYPSTMLVRTLLAGAVALRAAQRVYATERGPPIDSGEWACVVEIRTRRTVLSALYALSGGTLPLPAVRGVLAIDAAAILYSNLWEKVPPMCAACVHGDMDWRRFTRAGSQRSRSCVSTQWKRKQTIKVVWPWMHAMLSRSPLYGEMNV